MKMTPLFTHLQPILDVYDFLLSREYNQSCIKKSLKMAANGCQGF